jgi:hypothetical protein
LLLQYELSIACPQKLLVCFYTNNSLKPVTSEICFSVGNRGSSAWKATDLKLIMWKQKEAMAATAAYIHQVFV